MTDEGCEAAALRHRGVADVSTSYGSPPATTVPR